MRLLPEPAIAIAAAQHAVLARWQLRRWMSIRAVDGHVRRGNLEPCGYGVYRIPGTNRPEQAPVAAALRARPEAVVTGPFVLAHLRLDHFAPNAPFEVLTVPGRQLRTKDFEHRPDWLQDREVVHLGEVRLASAVDALLDSALWRGRVPSRSLRVAKDQLGWRGLVTSEALTRRIDERGEHDPAVRAFLELFEGHDLLSESNGERGLGRLLSQLDPAPEAQQWVLPHRRVDWYLRLLRLAFEYQGRIDHAHPEGRRADAVRDAELAMADIEVFYVTDADLRHPQTLLAAIVRVAERRAAELGVLAPRLRAS
ncbi:MAG: hypothetical protein WD378_07725 [Egicoccus sp.]